MDRVTIRREALDRIVRHAAADLPNECCGLLIGSADAIARYKEDVPVALNRVRTMSGETLASTLNLFDMMKAPGVNFLAMALKHSVHHRGQLSTYLRAMGGKVPGIYGPTADTQS